MVWRVRHSRVLLQGVAVQAVEEVVRILPLFQQGHPATLLARAALRWAQHIASFAEDRALTLQSALVFHNR